MMRAWPNDLWVSSRSSTFDRTQSAPDETRLPLSVLPAEARLSRHQECGSDSDSEKGERQGKKTTSKVIEVVVDSSGDGEEEEAAVADVILEADWPSPEEEQSPVSNEKMMMS